MTQSRFQQGSSTFCRLTEEERVFSYPNRILNRGGGRAVARLHAWKEIKRHPTRFGRSRRDGVVACSPGIRCLHGYVPEEELDLFQFASGKVT